MESEQCDWSFRPLGDLVENFDFLRVPVKESDRRPGPYPYYGASGIVDHVEDYIFDGEYLLIAEDGENLRTRNTPIAFMASGRFWVNNHAHIVRGNGDAITRYLSYALTVADVRAYLTGSTMPKLTQASLNRIPVIAPPLPHQKAIAHILGTLDDKIELNRRMNQTLEEMARALFKSWFVDFDPVRAKSEGRDPVGMDGETASLFPDGFEDSELGPIPRGWTVTALSTVVELFSGGTPKRAIEEYWGGDVLWFSVKDAPLPSDVFVIQTDEQITERGVDDSAAKVLPVGATIVTARGTVGKLALVGAPMAMNQSCYGVRSRHTGLDYFNYFRLQRAVYELQRRSHGSVFDTITRSTFDSVKIVEPPIATGRSFDIGVRQLLHQIKLNLFQNSTLTALRDALLPKLLSGELRIDDPERFLEEAALT